MAEWVEIPNRSGVMRLRQDQIVGYYDIGVALRNPDAAKGPRVSVMLKDAATRTFFMTAAEFGALLELQVPTPDKCPAAPEAPGYLPFPVTGSDYAELRGTLTRHATLGLTIEGAEDLTSSIRSWVQRSGGMSMRWGNLRPILSQQGYDTVQRQIIKEIVRTWAEGGPDKLAP